MADNKTYIIRETKAIHECDVCLYNTPNCENNCICPKEQGKTRAEWEDIIAESIYDFTVKKYSSSLSGLNPDECEKVKEESKELAKAVVDRLFGEGE